MSHVEDFNTEIGLGHDALPNETSPTIFSIENLMVLIFFCEFLALLIVVLLPHRFSFESLLRIGLLTIVLAWLQTGVYSIYYGSNADKRFFEGTISYNQRFVDAFTNLYSNYVWDGDLLVPAFMYFSSVGESNKYAKRFS